MRWDDVCKEKKKKRKNGTGVSKEIDRMIWILGLFNIYDDIAYGREFMNWLLWIIIIIII